jgi:D-arabinose 1-dehydrogenase-like Zn-dependent alcohol dehydrogenase
MKAAVVQKWGESFVIEDRPIPEPKRGEALLKIRAGGVGLTLLNMRSGRFGGTTPRIMGHELGGDVVATGQDVTNVKVGDRAVVYFYLVCGQCRWCRGGRETLCENFAGHVGVHRDGGFAEFVSLPSENCLKIPDGLSYEAAAVATDAVNTNWHCMRERARINPHDNVLLIGAGGGVGVHGVQVAKRFGANVIAADVSDEKLSLAKKFGADEIINVRAVNDVARQVKRMTDGRGVEAAIDFVGHGTTFQSAIDSLATGGRAVVVGVGQGNITFDPLRLVLSEQIVTGSRHSTRAELIETMEIMARGLVTPVIGKRVHFTQVESLFDDLRNERLLGRGAVTY